MNIKITFKNEDLKEKIYIEQPKGFLFQDKKKIDL